MHECSVINCKLCRKKSSSKNKSDFAVSANMAYGKISVNPVGEGVDGGDLEYMNPDNIIVMTEASTNESTQSSIPDAPEYASMEDTVGAPKTN